MAKRESEVVEMSGQICLKWNSFLSNIATSFESLWEEEGLVDVTLASDGQCLTAHKVILSASSPFFKKVFQTNPCRHPVIILQDVHFSELEALLTFIYKGEVNIEQEKLPALLKAAETLQIRGLSDGDISPKKTYKRTVDEDANSQDDDNSSIISEIVKTPGKKQKITKSVNNSILEKALKPRTRSSVSISESTCSDSKDDDQPTDSDTVLNPVYHRLEMKIEPFEMIVGDLQKQDIKEELERLDTGQDEVMQADPTIAGTSRVTVIAEARDISDRDKQATSNYEKSNLDDKEKMKNSPRRTANDARKDCPESLSSSVDRETSRSMSSNLNTEISENADEFNGQTVTKGGIVYPPFPCPFCDRAYHSWGFRRRHIKAVHTMSPKLNCKWCLQVMPTHAAWRKHVMSAHNLSASDAHSGLLILEEARTVLQIADPTTIDSLVYVVKENSQRSNNVQLDFESNPD